MDRIDIQVNSASKLEHFNMWLGKCLQVKYLYDQR